MENPTRQERDRFLPLTRQFYPLSFRSLRNLSNSTTGLPIINESDRSLTADGPQWNHLEGGRISPALSNDQCSTPSSWFPGSVQKHRLGRKEVAYNIHAFEILATTSRHYEDALREVSRTSMLYADALEQFSRVKDLSGPEDDHETEEDDLVEAIRSLSAYQFYIGSQQHVLAELVHKHCTSPLEAQYEAYRNTLIVFLFTKGS